MSALLFTLSPIIFKVKEPLKSISVLELKRVLVDLHEHTDVCVRFRMLGKFWDNSFMQIHSFTEKGVILYNPALRKTVEIPDLANIVQFEIDKKYQHFQPHNHYDVMWSPER
jgi:hypothetical protein